MKLRSRRVHLIQAGLPIFARHCLSVVLAVAVWAIPIRAEAANPEAAAKEFIEHVRHGALDKAVRLLESSEYRFQRPGGDDDYFRYESGYDPNLAFLVGRDFVAGTPSTARQQRSDWYIVDGTLYADVAVPLRFESRRPWILPAPMAFGRRMDFISFMNFISAPAADSTLLSLRIRSSIEPGQIKAPTPKVVALPSPGAQGAGILTHMSAGDSYQSLSGSRPVDPAPVVLPSGEALTAAQLSRFLPRLSAIRVYLSLIRRGRFSSWRVVRWNFANAVLITEKGEVIMGTVGAGERP